MTVTDVRKDLDNYTMTITARFDVTVGRAWQLWADPRQLERWWGPPTHPATFVEHDLTAGGTVTYFMTGPEGEEYHGWWKVIAADAPRRLEVEDGFADESGTPNPALPTTIMVAEFTEDGDATRMVMTSTFPSLDAMQEVLDMGMEEGIKSALGQIDAILFET